MKKISYSLFKKAKKSPCKRRAKVFLKEIGEEDSVSYEDLLDLPWINLLDVYYLYLYVPETVPKGRKIKKRELGYYIVKKLLFLFPHPIIDDFKKQYEEDGFLSYKFERQLVKLQRSFSSNGQIFLMFDSLFTLVDGEFTLSHLERIVKNCIDVLGEDSLLFKDNNEMKRLV